MSGLVLYLHIGFPKTGTSALQTFFALNTNVLSNHGVIYPETPNTAAARKGEVTPGNATILYGNLLPYPDEEILNKKLNTNRFVERLRFNIFASFLNTGKNILLSGEEVSWLNPEHLSGVKAFLADNGYGLKVIAYIRSQDDILLSGYIQGIKHHTVKSTLVECFEERKHNFLFNEYLDKLSELIGRENIVVRLYDRNNFEGGSIFTDFLKAIDIDADISSFQVPDKVINTSLGPVALEIVRQSSLRTYKAYHFPNMLSHIEGGQIFRFTNNKLLSAQPIIDELVEYYKDCNTRINQEYLKDSPNKLSINPNKYNNQDRYVLQESLPKLTPFDDYFVMSFEYLAEKVDRLEYEKNSILFHVAQTIFDSGNHPLAELFLRQLLTINPNRPDALVLLGRIHLHRGEAAQSIEFFKKAVLLDASSPGLMGNLFEAYFKLKHYQEAKQILLDGIAIHPSYQAWPAMVSQLLSKFDFKNELLESLQGIEETSIEGFNELAGLTSLLNILGDTGKALKLVMANRDKYLNSPQFLNHLANLLFNNGDIAQAVEYYRKAISLDPSLLEPRLELVKALNRMGDGVAALEEIDEAEKNCHPDPELYLVKTMVLFQKGKLLKAFQAARRTRKLAADNPEIKSRLKEVDSIVLLIKRVMAKASSILGKK